VVDDESTARAFEQSAGTNGDQLAKNIVIQFMSRFGDKDKIDSSCSGQFILHRKDECGGKSGF